MQSLKEQNILCRARQTQNTQAFQQLRESHRKKNRELSLLRVNFESSPNQFCNICSLSGFFEGRVKKINSIQFLFYMFSETVPISLMSFTKNDW